MVGCVEGKHNEPGQSQRRRSFKAVAVICHRDSTSGDIHWTGVSVYSSLSLFPALQDAERGGRNRTGDEAGREPEAGRCCPHALTVFTCSITTHPLELVT